MKNKSIDSFRDKYGIAYDYDCFPYKLSPLVKKLGYSIYLIDGKNNSDISGAVDYERQAIFVNDQDKYERQRFTIAHEIAHIYLSDNPQRIDYRSNFWNESEMQANQFAAELLMPAKIFKEIWIKENSSIIALSEFFGVSCTAVSYRAENLGLSK